MDWDATLERLRADRGNWAEVGRATGLTPVQIRRIVSGETPNPRIDTAQRIASYYDQRAQQSAAAPPTT